MIYGDVESEGVRAESSKCHVVRTDRMMRDANKPHYIGLSEVTLCKLDEALGL